MMNFMRSVSDELGVEARANVLNKGEHFEHFARITAEDAESRARFTEQGSQVCNLTVVLGANPRVQE